MNQRSPRTSPGPEGPTTGAGPVDAWDPSTPDGGGSERSDGPVDERHRGGRRSAGADSAHGADEDGEDPGCPTAGGSWSFRWALVGVALILGLAVVRLGSRALATLRSGLTGPEWAALVLLTGLFVYGEGIRALERRWVPFVAARARALSGRSLPWRLFGPLYAMALVGTRGRFVVRAWAGIVAVVAAVVLVHALPEPWRGVVDFAVAAALLWGVGALLGALVRGWR